MDRTARLYALVEELRAAAPRPVTVAALAARFEVSARTVQRDLQALMHSGVPVRAVTGRGGGWAVDPRTTLPPIRLTADEASALTAALATVDAATPYADAARTAAQKIAAALSGPGAVAARELAERIVALPPRHDGGIRGAVERALAEQCVLRLTYTDAAGQESERDVEPAGLLTAEGRWYLIAWCRTRRAGRGFRLDRITAAAPVDEAARPHDLSGLLLGSAGAGAAPPGALADLATAASPPRSRRTSTSPSRGAAPAS
ncbi:YafY family protein [Streptomyces sp. VRA16 Mangrove soil]|uniref:helix-turn-helix transcriptional regulator n=1 Tax=Streptomyces sp. VRA16 Mangrove soil TaxID=2817434 RepID=UPI001A9CD679|nr:WYL domain-containing protein [Streptomyces sp. VRA16 Mangrove soil]MBO1331545.1 WYL domain-containing protein [Streptomyces sp. VRA16 Mangrove soil]